MMPGLNFVNISSWVDDRGPPKKGQVKLCFGIDQLATCTCSTKAQAISLYCGISEIMNGAGVILGRKSSGKSGFINSADDRNICSTCCPSSCDALSSRSCLQMLYEMYSYLSYFSFLSLWSISVFLYSLGFCRL